MHEISRSSGLRLEELKCSPDAIAGFRVKGPRERNGKMETNGRGREKSREEKGGEGE